ncbi:MAG TPA: cbb3-type cytochrome c oxidase subunit II [Armatimonadota bacterium]|nr:cbb3-type cytochrome c oxidase subunit II [Armatimonadota bacterium]
MQMTEKVFSIGSLLILISAAMGVAVMPGILLSVKPSNIARPYTPLELEGRGIYISNGCTYCHSQYIRPQDFVHGAVRVSEAGDYYYDKPHLLGSERTGPDLAQEGGIRTDDWIIAHFIDPRFTRPASIMPDFRFLTPHQMNALTAYIQSLGGKMADARVKRLNVWHKALVQAYKQGPDRNDSYLQTLVPEGWRVLPNPYPATPDALARGKYVYEQECVGCHGNFGDGHGPASPYLYPKPANFTTLRRIGASGGLLYYQIMNGITGTAMMSFKRELESAKIWDVSNYIAVNFIGKSDAETAPYGVDEVQEPVNPNAPPPPPVSSVKVPPPTSPALQPAVNKAWNKNLGPPPGRPEPAVVNPGYVKRTEDGGR